MSTEREELAKLLGDHYGTSAGGDDYLWAMADILIERGYRKVETVWAETLINDGTYEYTSSSDCDGSNVYHWRRKPSVQLEMVYSPWESYAPEGDN